MGEEKDEGVGIKLAIQIYFVMRIDFTHLNQGLLLKKSPQRFVADSVGSLHSPSMTDLQPSEPDLISFSVKYPYDISKALATTHLEKEITYLKAKQLLPEASLRFISREVQKQMIEMSIHKSESRRSQASSPEKIVTKKSVAQNLQKRTRFAKEDSLKMNYTFIQPTKRKFNQREFRPIRSKNSQEKMNEKAIETAKYGKRSNEASTYLPAKTKRSQRTVNDMGTPVDKSLFNPQLNYTMNSSTQKKIKQQRNKYFHKEKTNVFQSLFMDGKRYEHKRSLERLIAEEKRSIQREKVFLDGGKKVRNLGNFEQRLKKSLQKQGQNKRLHEKYHQIDISTGERLFVPNLRGSKKTYETLFKPICNVLREKSIKKINCFQHSQSLDKSSEKDVETTIQMVTHSSLQKMVSTQRALHLNKTTEIVNQIEASIAERYIKMFYNSPLATNFMRRYESISTLSHAEYQILDPFFHRLQDLEQTQSVNRHAFAALLRQFYKQLTLYDKQILRHCFFMDRKINRLLHNPKKENQETGSVRVAKSGSAKKTDNHYTQSIYYV